MHIENKSGDSYSTTKFDIREKQPSVSNPMGNPKLGELPLAKNERQQQLAYKNVMTYRKRNDCRWPELGGILDDSAEHHAHTLIQHGCWRRDN